MNTETRKDKINLEEKYINLIRKYDFENFIISCNVDNVNKIIKESIINFMKTHNRVAIYGNGLHTEMLMVDFVFELKNVKYIIDNYYSAGNSISNGYTIIREAELDKHKIDGVILSSYYYRNNFRKSLSLNHSDIDYLDFYSELEKENIFLNSGYYDINHPYSRYQSINQVQNRLNSSEDYWELLKRYIQIKDFLSARKYALQFYEKYPDEKVKDFIQDIEDMIASFNETVRGIAKRNVLMLCIDTLAREGLYGESMPKLLNICRQKGTIFDNAYSYSTSTYESLVPVYSENSDMRTGYYNESEVMENNCRFIQEAKEQGRNIYFYTDGFNYVNSEAVLSRENFHSVSEKMWGFVLDAAKENNGFFYLHILYESHHPYPNPYVREPIIGHGGSAVYDFFPKNGGKVRADYVAQLNASLHYLDDQLSPLLSNIDCRILLYSDHGVFIIGKNTSLIEMPSTLLGADEERIRIPLVVFSPEMKKRTNEKLISLMELNEIMLSLLRGEEYHYQETEFIKIGRSEIYSPNYKYICKQRGAELESMAFEGFIFESGHKLIVYANRTVKLYNLEDEEIQNNKLKNALFAKICGLITVF